MPKDFTFRAPRGKFRVVWAEGRFVADWDFKSKDFDSLARAKNFADRRAKIVYAEVYNDKGEFVYSGRKS